MRSKERRDNGQKNLFRARLDQIVDIGQPLAKLAATIDWGFLEQRFGTAYGDVPGRPPLATQLMAGLAILTSYSLRNFGYWREGRSLRVLPSRSCAADAFHVEGRAPA